MKAEEIKLALQKNSETHIQFQDSKTIQKNIDDAKKELSKLESFRDNYLDAVKKMDSIKKDFDAQSKNVNISISFINESAKELEQKAKDLGLGNQPIVEGSKREAQNIKKQLDNLLKSIK
jgi:hypothetical protein